MFEVFIALFLFPMFITLVPVYFLWNRPKNLSNIGGGSKESFKSASLAEKSGGIALIIVLVSWFSFI